MRRNVLQLIGSFHTGGSERQAVQLSRLLREDKSVRVFIACLNAEGALRGEVERFYENEIASFPLSSFFDSNFLSQIRRFAGFVKENEIDIIHTHDFYTNVFGMFGAKYAGIAGRIASKRETEGMRSRSQKLVERQAFRLAKGIVANSQAVKKHLISNGIPERKVSVVYNGLDLNKFKNDFSRQKVLADFGLPEKKLVTIVANLRHAVKNQEMFLRAARRVKEKYQNAAFVLAGEGERIRDLKQLAIDFKIENDVFFIGSCQRVAELLGVSEICVLSSRAEGFSNAILEYMAAARPVVATNVGGASEVIFEGENGFLIESKDDGKLAAKILFLLENSDTARKMGEKGREIVEDNFSLAAQLENTLALYERVLIQT